MFDEKVEHTTPGNSPKMAHSVVPGRLYQLIGEVLSFTAQVDQGVAPGDAGPQHNGEVR
jgi:hypothetical protein